MTKTHGGPRPGSGRKTKASKGKHKAKQLSITIPWESWLSINAKRKEGETTSRLIQRLLLYIEQGEKNDHSHP